MARVIIGVDPHKRSATIEVINEREQTIGHGRFGTDTDGYKAMLAAAGAVMVWLCAPPSDHDVNVYVPVPIV